MAFSNTTLKNLFNGCVCINKCYNNTNRLMIINLKYAIPYLVIAIRFIEKVIIVFFVIKKM